MTVRCQQNPSVVVRLHGRYFPDRDGVTFGVTAEADGLQAHVGVELWVSDREHLPDFLDKLAADFRGWNGERAWKSNDLWLHATFHSRGRVSLTWTLRRSSPPESWHAAITTWQDAGEQMRALATDIRYFLRQEPSDHG